MQAIWTKSVSSLHSIIDLGHGNALRRCHCWAKYEVRTIRSTIRSDYGLGYFEDGKKIGEVYREVA